MLGITDCVADRVWLAVPEPTEWQRIGNQINPAMDLCAGGLRKLASLWFSISARLRWLL
jgi:hypothetical protein